MTTTETTTGGVRTALSALVAPLREQLAQLDAEIAAHRAELAEMTAARRDAEKALALLDPTFKPANQPERPPAKQRAPRTAEQLRKTISAETLERIYAWLVEHVDEVNGNGGASAPGLIDGGSYDLTSRATLTKALTVLHAQDRLRLDHRGKGGEKFYKVVV